MVVGHDRDYSSSCFVSVVSQCVWFQAREVDIAKNSQREETRKGKERNICSV